MKVITTIALFLIYLASSAQNQNATTEDGKKVILKADKTWEYSNQESKMDNSCRVDRNFKEPKYNTSSSWKKIGSTVDDLKKHISVDLGVKQEKIILLEVSEQLGNAIYILCVDGIKLKYRRTGSVFRKDNEDVLKMD